MAVPALRRRDRFGKGPPPGAVRREPVLKDVAADRLGEIALIWGLALLLAAAAVPVSAEGLADQLGGRDEADITYLALRTIPSLVYEARPDSLLEWITAWENAGGPREAISRILILGAVWDGQFGEDLYGYTIIDDLLWHADERRLRQESPPVSGDLITAGIADEDPYAAASRAFDAFTRDFADQLLPHMPSGSPEEFFCLFYAGRQAEAWSLLDEEALAGTDLRYYRDQRIEALQRKSRTVSVAIVGGGWFPFGPYAFAGDHALAGLQYGTRGRDWFLRLALEFRLGRTSRAYRVDQDGFQGVSDRFNALLLGVELGRAGVRLGPYELNAFVGAGVDAVRPFAAQDVLLQAMHLSAGAGCRLDLGERRAWFLALDYRREWVGKRNEKATRLYGDAWSLRAGLGLNFGQENRDTLSRLRP